MSAPETVWLKTNRSDKTLHADPECPSLNNATNVTSKPSVAIPEGFFSTCSRCWPGGAR